MLAAYCRSHGERDEKGSYAWHFPSPVVIGGQEYHGVRLQASQPSPEFDEDAAQALIASLGPQAVAAATRTEIVWDYDYLFLARQQDQITDEDLDKVIVVPEPKYSLTVLRDRS